MRRVILNMTMSLDGFVAGPNNELDWMSQLSDQQLIDDTVELFSRFDSGFIGYPTASGMIPYWRSVAANASASKAERAIAGAVNKLHPYVVSNRDAKLDLDGAELLLVRDNKDLVEAVTRIKKCPVRIWEFRVGFALLRPSRGLAFLTTISFSCIRFCSRKANACSSKEQH